MERPKVIATLTTGETHEGDVLIGADGINSKMRAQMRGEDPNNPPLAYAGYAVYTAICDYSAPHRDAIHTDVDKTGYQVRLLPIRPRSRAARRSLRTFPVVTLHPRFPFNV